MSLFEGFSINPKKRQTVSETDDQKIGGNGKKIAYADVGVDKSSAQPDWGFLLRKISSVSVLTPTTIAESATLNAGHVYLSPR